ncbi:MULTISPECIES: O-acetyl-ADP-ribose deacetylase [unclassified Halomonas]|uniref:O-acetyl-ADP-ribose deacetylase n=1 Tax=unclassified Halomonas TaxID=2609666 RepID=UPI002076868B|nr:MULTISPECIES: O-acetyl-ADP-ribose deacetylase [unclassified Halomonas]
MKIDAIQADITTLGVDAIVNAANQSLLGGGGVDGAIHRAAGRELKEACRTLGGCETGDAKLTDGFALPSRYVIHAVGPVWNGGQRGEAEKLAGCYRRAMELAESVDARSIAFPSISTGIYRFPIEKAAEIAVETVKAALSENSTVESVTFCCFSESDLAVYEALLNRSAH